MLRPALLLASVAATALGAQLPPRQPPQQRYEPPRRYHHHPLTGELQPEGPFAVRLALEVVRGVFNSFTAWMSLRMLLARTGGLNELIGRLSNRTATQDLDQPVVNCTTSFADVAGIDEVVEELQEAVAYLRDPERFSRRTLALGLKPGPADRRLTLLLTCPGCTCL